MTIDEYMELLISIGSLTRFDVETLKNSANKNLEENVSQKLYPSNDTINKSKLPLGIAPNNLEMLSIVPERNENNTYSFAMSLEKDSLRYNIEGKVSLVVFRSGIEFKRNEWSSENTQAWKIDFSIACYDFALGLGAMPLKKETISIQNYNSMWEAIEVVAFKDPEHWFNINSDFLTA